MIQLRNSQREEMFRTRYGVGDVPDVSVPFPGAPSSKHYDVCQSGSSLNPMV